MTDMLANPYPQGGGVNTNRPSACTNCHAAKVKCDFNTPCERCVRLGKTCIPHVSQQGRGRKKRRKNKSETREEDAEGPSSGSAFTALARRPKKQRATSTQATEDVLYKSLGSLGSTINRNHFGMKFLIRSWVSFAIRRRSFTLLSRAGTLATKLGLSMDDIMCSDADLAPRVQNGDDGDDVTKEEGSAATSGGNSPKSKPYDQSAVDFLYPALITPSDRQDLGSTRLKWSEVPSDLLASAGCCAKSSSLGLCSNSQNKAEICDGGHDDTLLDAECEEKHKEAEEKVKEVQNATEVATIFEEKTEAEVLAPLLGDRWIIIREMNQGRSRYFVSPAFERDICSWESVRDTWHANEREVSSLFIPGDEKAAYVKALMHQITMQERAGNRPRASRHSCRIMVRSGSDKDDSIPVKVDSISCMKIVNVDTAFAYNEFVRAELSTAETLASMSTVAAGEEQAPARQAVPLRSVTPSASLPSTSPTPIDPSSETEQGWLDLDQITEFGELDELLDFLDDARSSFENDIM